MSPNIWPIPTINRDNRESSAKALATETFMQGVIKHVEGNAYVKNQVAQVDGWLMICAEGTEDSPKPLKIGSPTLSIGDNLTSIDGFSGRVLTGNRYTFTSSGFVSQILVWVPVVPKITLTYRLLVYNVTTGEASWTNISPSVSNAWEVVNANTNIINIGDEYDVMLEALDTSAETTWGYNWARASNDNDITTDPTDGFWGTKTNNTSLRISKVDLTTTDRVGELELLVPGSILEISSLSDPTISMSWYINSVGVDEGQHFSFSDVNYLGQGSGGAIDIGQDCAIKATIPVAATTLYSQRPAFWASNAPDWGTAKGHIIIDTDSLDTNAYGVDIKFQRAEMSPDWNLMAYSSSIGSTPSGTQIINTPSVFSNLDVLVVKTEKTVLLDGPAYTLPLASTISSGLVLNCKNMSGSTCIISVSGSDNIDGELTQNLENNDNIRIQADPLNNRYLIL